MIKELTMAKQSLTSNWEYGTLGDAVNKGSSNISLNKVKEDDGEYQLYSAKGYNKNISFFHQEKEYLAIIKDGAGIGRVSKHPAKSSVVATMQYLIPKEGFDIGFVQYFLNGIDFESHRQGSTIPHVYFKDYKSEPFPLLPLTQQKQIVAILDKAFAAIDTAKANAEQNLQNAKKLFESYLQNVFSTKGDDWEKMTLGEIAIVKSGGTPSRARKEFWDGNIAWYSSGELNNTYTTIPERHINQLAIDNSTAKRFKKGSLLIGMYDTAALKMSILDREGAFNQAISGVLPNENIDLQFILHSINSIKPEILSLRRGVRQKNLNLTKIKNIPIYLPPIKQQIKIVQKLDALSAECEKLEAIYTQKIADLDEMKKSVLQKAFSGQLNTIN
ncbi:MAG: type I restriction enzyme S subunit [Vicingaceae bacterium]|jgi:type I restriction enzyme S subunit